MAGMGRGTRGTGDGAPPPDAGADDPIEVEDDDPMGAFDEAAAVSPSHDDERWQECYNPWVILNVTPPPPGWNGVMDPQTRERLKRDYRVMARDNHAERVGRAGVPQRDANIQMGLVNDAYN